MNSLSELIVNRILIVSIVVIKIFSHFKNYYYYYYFFFHENYFYFFMFQDVPESSGMFRNVPCSGFYRRPPEQPVTRLGELDKLDLLRMTGFMCHFHIMARVSIACRRRLGRS